MSGTALCWISCHGQKLDLYAADAIIDLKPGAFYVVGDTPYVNANRAIWGFTATQAHVGSTAEDFEDHYDSFHGMPGLIRTMAAVPFNFVQWDDHEWGGDNWDHTVTQANAQTGIGAATQADVNNHWYQGVLGAIRSADLRYDNPANDHVLAIAELPQEVIDNTPSEPISHYPVRYYKVGYDANGKVTTGAPTLEVFMMDPISYRSTLAATDDASKTMFGANQLAWLKAELAASQATYKAIFSKLTFRNASGGGNGDTHHDYQTERDSLLTWIDNASGWLVPGGVVWLTGDQHFPHIMVNSSPNHLCVCACPSGVDNNWNGAWSTSEGVPWVSKTNQVFGSVFVGNGYLEAQIRSVEPGGAILWKGRILPGSNALSYPALRSS